MDEFYFGQFVQTASNEPGEEAGGDEQEGEEGEVIDAFVLRLSELSGGRLLMRHPKLNGTKSIGEGFREEQEEAEEEEDDEEDDRVPRSDRDTHPGSSPAAAATAIDGVDHSHTSSTAATSATESSRPVALAANNTDDSAVAAAVSSLSIECKGKGRDRAEKAAAATAATAGGPSQSKSQSFRSDRRLLRLVIFAAFCDNVMRAFKKTRSQE